MSVFRSRPALRWLVPSAAAVVVIGGGAIAGTIVASADPSLPERSAAQLLVDLQNAKVDGLSGTIVQSADLGLPQISGLTTGNPLTSLIAGSNTARVWYAGEDKARLALLGTDGETDVIRNGNDVWIWQEKDKAATHVKVPAGKGEKPQALPGGVPSTPQEAADAALAAIDDTTQVSTTGAAKVAGRDAYELVLSPRAKESLIGQVRLAVDAEQHIPLRVDVYAKNATSPAVRVAFQQISFDKPDAQQFAFNPPPGTKVTESNLAELEKGAEKKAEAHKPPVAGSAAKPGEGPKVVGEGWASIVTAKLPKASGEEGKQIDGVLGMLPEASGTWGKGRIFAGSLFSVLITDDGRVLGGAVSPEALYAEAAKK
ncbi:LolA family protein [Actinoplanes solisilvae]|uniref:LolA family protein n=1 Tax=Actinoplanes solisilvae TaxID=2486853 RepID=UPI000FDC7518|nr:sigma-E factor regulatory protein RseB domain-containing protein [Actinoplanes solisilvae]